MIKRALQYLKRSITKPEGLKSESAFPVSEYFGEDRGTPIDRFYIEQFLEQNKASIKGKLLEIAENKYSRRLGTNVISSDVLHPIAGTAGATIIGDLTDPSTLPAGQFDCFICTQTIHVIYKYLDAIKGAHHLLKPGGVLLATLAGITQVSKYDMERWGDYWRFTTRSAEMVFEEVFGKGNVEVDYFGNCYSAVNFLRGLAVEEVNLDTLKIKDPNYQVLITVVATKR